MKTLGIVAIIIISFTSPAWIGLAMIRFREWVDEVRKNDKV